MGLQISEKKTKTGFSIKAVFTKLIIWFVNKLNFVKFSEKIALSSAGQDLARQFSALPQSWADAEKISALAVDLTCTQLIKEGQKPDKQAIPN